MCNILIEFGIHIQIIRLIKISLGKKYSGVRVSKLMSDMFPITKILKQGVALSLFFYNFSLDYAIRLVQVN